MPNDYTSYPEVEIIRLASDGTGVGFIEGKATFVTGMLPGEKGKVRITEDKKKYQRAVAMEIREISPERNAPPCSIYNHCGGCELQHMNYSYSLEWKRRWVEDALSRIGGIKDIVVEPVIGMEAPWRYRNKAVLHRDEEGRIGYYKHKTKQVVEFDDCLLLSRDINTRIRKFQDILGKSCPGISTVTFRESNRGKGLVLLDGNTKAHKELEPLVKELKKEESFSPQVCSIAIPQGNNDFEGSGAQYLNEYMTDLRFRVSPRAFLQVNPSQTNRMYGMVLEWAELSGSEEVWDLYCGIGTITLFLARKAKSVIGVEENPYAIEDAIQNAQGNGFDNVRFIQGKVEDKIKDLSRQPDIVVTDPPRAGMEPLVVERLLEIKPEKIIYVSCNPATLARDLKALGCTSSGCSRVYEVRKVQPIDMFPWTGHVECVVGIQKVESMK